jgi:hypothetical protein
MIAIIYIFSVIEPSIIIAESSVKDISNTTQARLAAEKLANSLNDLLISEGEGKKTIHILVPEGSQIECNASGSTIDFEVILSENIETVSKCPNSVCSGSVSLVSNQIACALDFVGKEFYTLELIKTGSGVVNVQNV